MNATSNTSRLSLESDKIFLAFGNPEDAVSKHEVG